MGGGWVGVTKIGPAEDVFGLMPENSNEAKGGFTSFGLALTKNGNCVYGRSD